MHINFASSISDVRPLNSSFDTGVLRVCYTGANRNGSYISKDAIERALPTIYNCPVVCNYDRETDTLGGHDVAMARDADGKMSLINLTQPVGVIPESANTWFDNHQEEDGTVHEYLCTDVILWKRQEAYQKIHKDGIVSHSMEISVRDGCSDADGLYHINSFEFNAFALIGVEPCFEGSALEVFAANEFKQQMQEMMQELKECFSTVATSNDVYDDINNGTEGGEKELENVDKTATEEVVQQTEQNNDYTLTSNIVDEIVMALESQMVDTSYGQRPRYCFADCDLDAHEVYGWDSNDWLLYGFSYTMNGDSINIDFESAKRKKYAIVDFDGGEQVSPFAKEYSMAVQRINDLSNIEDKFAQASASLEAANAELNELREFKHSIETQNAQAERDEVFSMFSDLESNEEFEALKQNCAEYDRATLEEKCYAIRGRAMTPAKFSLENKTPKLMVDKVEVETKPYGDLFDKYNK